MRRFVGMPCPACCGAVVAALCVLWILGGWVAESVVEPNTVAVGGYGDLPLAFEPNVGQAPGGVDYLARGSGYTVLLTADDVTLRLAPGPAVRLRWLGSGQSEPEPQVAGLDPLPGRSHYLIGNDPGLWRRDVPHYARVAYRRVYPGVDLVFYGRQGELEYDFVVAPGADPAAIRIGFEGVDERVLDAEGNLVLRVGAGEVVQRAPLIYQEVDGGRARVSGGYLLGEDGGVGFEIGEYDPSLPLVIDPLLAYSTYLGGGAAEGQFGRISIAVDDGGNAYVAGRTASADFPTSSALDGSFGGGTSDAFIAKLDPAGSSLLYSTYLGGDSQDEANGVAVDAAGNAYVTGFSNSSDFPETSALGSGTAFVTKLDRSGSSVVYSVRLGLAGGGVEGGQGVAVDAAGSAYVVGTTDGTDFTTVNAFQGSFGGGFDAFVSKLNAAGTALVYSTYLGGTTDEDDGAIGVDAAGRAYVVGTTDSTDFPTSNAVQPTLAGGDDAFVTKFSGSGTTLVHSTFLGGIFDDAGGGVAVDGAGHAYVVGTTSGGGFPTVNAFQPADTGSLDSFVSKVLPGGGGLVFSTFLGGTASEFGFAGIAVDASGGVYVAGQTSSTNFPTLSAVQPAHAGGFLDAVVTRFAPSGSRLIYSTYLGGSGDDSGTGIAVAGSSAFVVGTTDSADFLTVRALQPARAGGLDAFVAELASPLDFFIASTRQQRSRLVED